MNILKHIQLLFFVMTQSCMVVAMDLTHIGDPDTDFDSEDAAVQVEAASKKDKLWVEQALSCPHSGSWTVRYWSGKTVKTVIVEGKMIYDKNITQSYEPIYLFSVSKPQPDGQKQLLGSVTFRIKKDFAYGNVEMFNFEINANEPQMVLEKILASAIFKLLPETKRIFLEVNCNNEKAMQTYEKLDFIRCSELWYNVLYEYLAKDPIKGHSTLQSVAKIFEISSIL